MAVSRPTVQVLDAVRLHQQPVGVDAVRRTGDQRTQLLAVLDLQMREVRRLHDPDMIHLIGKGLIQDRQRERVALAQLPRCLEAFLFTFARVGIDRPHYVRYNVRTERRYLQ